MRNSGLIYYMELLGMDTGTYRVHYRFDQSGSGAVIPNDANYPQNTGRLSSVGQFYNVSGSGFFSGQSITIGAANQLPIDFFSHVFIYEKTGVGGGVVFDSFVKNTIASGYTIGINDANRLYFQYQDGEGPATRTSDLVLGDKNLVAVAKANNSISFYNYDFSTQSSYSDEFAIDGGFVFASPVARLGNSLGSGWQLGKSYSGFLSEYIILEEAISPSVFQYLCSGLASDYSVAPVLISTGSLNLVTGYLTGVTGVTGVTGYVNLLTGSGLNVFGTGDYELFYQTSGITGFLATGLNITPLTGLVNFYLTGDPIETLTIRTSFIQSFGYEELSFIRKITPDDVSASRIPSGQFIPLNLPAEFNDVEGSFQLDNIYTPDQIITYANGQAQFYSGFSVTGNIYGSGIVISGDFILDQYFLKVTGFYSGEDRLTYDVLSGLRAATFVTGIFSGLPAAIPSNANTYYLNGQLLLSGLNYYFTGNQFRWASDVYSGVSGVLTAFGDSNSLILRTGTFFSPYLRFAKLQNQLYLNGQRQLHGENYISNAKTDLIRQSGIFEEDLFSLYNGESGFFE